MGAKLIVIQDVNQARAIGQKVDEQGEQDGEGEEFHDKHLARLNNIRQAPLLIGIKEDSRVPFGRGRSRYAFHYAIRYASVKGH